MVLVDWNLDRQEEAEGGELCQPVYPSQLKMMHPTHELVQYYVLRQTHIYQSHWLGYYQYIQSLPFVLSLMGPQDHMIWEFP